MKQEKELIQNQKNYESAYSTNALFYPILLHSCVFLCLLKYWDVSFHAACYISEQSLYKMIIKELLCIVVIFVFTQVWYNPEGHHTMPAYLNSLNNFILRSNLPPEKRQQYGSLNLSL